MYDMMCEIIVQADADWITIAGFNVYCQYILYILLMHSFNVSKLQVAPWKVTFMSQHGQ